MPDPLFQILFAETDTMRWPPADVVQERARRRVRRTRASVVAAAVVMVGAVAGGVAVARLDPQAGPQPGTSQSAAVPTPSGSSPSPSEPAGSSSAGSASRPATEPTSIVDALFLQPDDVGPGYRVLSGQEGSGDWTFEFSTSSIGCQVSNLTRWNATRRSRVLSRGTPQAEDLVAQYVARYSSGDAARYLDQVRSRVDGCRPDSGKSIRIGAQRFAGQDALLIEVNHGDGFTTTHVLVRQGDLLTEFFTKPERSSAAAQELGREAARRLCAGTPVC